MAGRQWSHDDSYWTPGVESELMTTDVHQLDDGAWISVNDDRQVNVSDLWPLAGQTVCNCALADFLIEGFVEVGVDHPDIQARVAGQCIRCGREGVTGWITVGRVVDPESGTFYPVDPGSVRLPEGTASDSRLD